MSELLIARADALFDEGAFEESIKVYVECARRGPDADAPIVRLQSLLHGDSEVARLVFNPLERLLRSRNNHSGLAEVLEHRLKGVAPSSDARAEWIQELATLYESLGQPESALSWRQRAFAERPGVEPARLELERLAEQGSKWEALRTAYEEALQRHAGALSPERCAFLSRRAAELAEQLGHGAAALSHWQKLSELDPCDSPAAAAVERLMRQEGDAESLCRWYLRRANRSESLEERRSALQNASHLAEENLADDELAERVYQSWTDRFPADAPAWAGLHRLFASAGRYTELAAVIHRELALETPNDSHRVELWWEIAQLAKGPLADLAGAVKFLDILLAVDPKHDSAVDMLAEIAFEPIGEEEPAGRRA